jgi:hypothetical protein
MANFKEKEQTVGYVTLLSGSIVIADGIHAEDLSCAASQRVVLDLGKENVRIPVIAAKQQGQRFLLIPIDAATRIDSPNIENVDTEDRVDIPKPEKSPE